MVQLGNEGPLGAERCAADFVRGDDALHKLYLVIYLMVFSKATRMVLWEITLGTAYFLGLKRTYRLALRIQRKIIRPKYPKIRNFLHGRTRAVFDVAIKVHRNIQDRDIEAGRNLGNFILRWLDRMKPSARIAGPPTGPPSNGDSRERVTKNTTGTSNNKSSIYSGFFKRDSDRHLFSSSRPKPFPTISRMTRPPNPAGTSIHGRRLSVYAPEVLRSSYRINESGGVFRKELCNGCCAINCSSLF